VGFWRSLRGPKGYEPPATAELASGPRRGGPRFETSIDSGVLYGAPTLEDWIQGRIKISRGAALRVPAVKRARDLICGALGQFPLVLYGPDGKPVDWGLFTQPEAGKPRSITITHTVEDLLLDGRAWWWTTHVGWHNRPVEVERLDAETVTIQPRIKTYPFGSVTVWPEIPGLLRFDSPNGGILNASAAIRACAALENATLNAINGMPPIDWFTPADGDVDPLNDDEVDAALTAWEEKRRARRTAYVPAALKYEAAGWDLQKLQLIEAREFAIKEVARLTGIDAEELSVPTTTRTYANMQDRRRTRIEDTLGPYMVAIEGRTGMDDVTPHGYVPRFDTSAYLRLDDLSAAQSDSVLVAAKILTRDEARAKRSLEPLGEPEPATDPTAAVASALATAATIQSGNRHA
jgi:hypothetical protein